MKNMSQKEKRLPPVKGMQPLSAINEFSLLELNIQRYTYSIVLTSVVASNTALCINNLVVIVE